MVNMKTGDIKDIKHKKIKAKKQKWSSIMLIISKA